MTHILLTRSREGNLAWTAELKTSGLEVTSLDCLVHEPVADDATRERLALEWQQADWMVFTSVRGVESVAAVLSTALSAALSAALQPTGPRLAAVGEATAEACRRRLGRCDLLSPVPTGKGLAQHLLARLSPGQRIVAPVADRGRRDLEEVLEPHGIQVQRMMVYRTRVASAAGPKLELNEMGLDAVFFGSPSAIEGLSALAHWDAQCGIPAVAIGPTTAQALESRGFLVTVAARPSLAGMLAALERLISQPTSTSPETSG